MNAAIMMTNAQLYFALSVPLLGILFNTVVMTLLFATLSRRIDRLEDRVHTGHDMLIGKIGELDTRLARLEERLPK